MIPWKYIYRNVVGNRNNSTIKMVSLSLGFAAGLVILAMVAFELSYDRFLPDAGRLYYISARMVENGEMVDDSPAINAPYTRAMMQTFPEVESATITSRWGEQPFYRDNKKFMPHTLYADQYFFQTLGFRVIQGDDSLLAVADNILLSDKMAKRIFGTVDEAVGQSLKYANNHVYTVAGIFESVPANSHLTFDAVASFENIKTQFGRDAGWDRDDSYTGYVKLIPGADVFVVEKKIPQLTALYKDMSWLADEEMQEMYYLDPVTRFHLKYNGSRNMLLVLSFLSVVVLVVAAMNYIMITLSSLPLKAKAVVIHKCNGATRKNIFGMFISETALLVLLSLLAAALLLLLFRGKIESLSGLNFIDMFHFSNLWLLLGITGMVFLIAGVFPARAYAIIPVIQVFRTMRSGRSGWKRGLLFFQFTGVAFVLLLLMITIRQVNWITKKDVGYNPDNLAYISTGNLPESGEEGELMRIGRLKQELSHLPFVTHVGTHNYLPVSGYSGQIATDEDNNYLFTTRWAEVDIDYLPLLGVSFVAGQNSLLPGELVVNETFVRMMGWDDSPIGKEVWGNDGKRHGTITAVVKDFAIRSLNDSQNPVMIQIREMVEGFMTVRLTSLDQDVLADLNERLLALFPDQDLEFYSLNAELERNYAGQRHFRDTISTAFVIILLLAGAGLLGYITDEILHRRKEMALRRINGGTVSNILLLFFQTSYAWRYPPLP